METEDAKLLSIGELAERTGVSRRTVRFYVQRGLIAPPEGRGRGSGYTEAHVEQVLRVRQLQRNGLVLDTIRHLGGSDEEQPAALPAFTTATVCRIDLAEGVRLEIDAQRIPPDPRVLAALAEACNRIMGLQNKEEGDDDENAQGADHGKR
jgi:DNA-binding transcriptional MerR regulator